MDVDRAIDELYALPPDDFTAARDEQAALARVSGDATSAAALRKLRRPSRSAWLVNQLVRHRGDAVDQLLDLGSALRDAQKSLAGDDLRRLSAQRSAVVSALARDARQLAEELGQPVNDAIAREVETTLDAALADPAAAEQVRSGRLTTSLQHSGFGTGADEIASRRPAKKPVGKSDAPADDGAEAKKALSVARAETQEAEKRERAEEANLAAASARREKTVRRVAGLEEDLAHARQEDAAAADDVRSAHRRRDAATKSLDAARQKEARAKERLDKGVKR
ncbi:MAG: hypothetical protein QOG53_1280 [Frankiales bacterium]|jgi:hypothetical protein|nr:hypothetical protein [Frankiales bacterium]